MKRLISAFAVVSLFTVSCSKELSTPPSSNSASDSTSLNVDDWGSHGSDDKHPDDHGGKNGGGGGDRVSSSSVPSAVVNAFNARYTGTKTNVEWKKLSDGSYRVEFFQGSIKIQATFSAAGAFLREERN